MKPLHRIIGWIGHDELTPAQAADRAIAKASEVLQGLPGVLHLDKLTGRLTLHADIDATIPPATFVRGVRFDSDPDVLAYDLRSEAMAAKLIGGYQASRKPPTRKVTATSRPDKDAALTRIDAGERVGAVAKAMGIPRNTIYRWLAEMARKSNA